MIVLDNEINSTLYELASMPPFLVPLLQLLLLLAAKAAA